MKKTAWDNVHGIERILISFKDAKEAGHSFYFTGRPCQKAGHVTLRYVSGNCQECVRLYDLERTSKGKRRVAQSGAPPEADERLAEDCTIMPADLTAPITDAERAYWAARSNADGCLALLGKIIRQALADGDERGAQRLCEALGLNYRVIASQAGRVLPNQAKKAKA